jgi:very-short-patch-repair endonuclease
MSKLEDDLLFQIKSVRLPMPIREFKFHPKRKWRFDFCWPDIKLACECEGGIYIKGGHSTGQGIEKDIEKYNAAMELGWDVYRCTNKMIKAGVAVQTLERLIKIKSEKFK